MIIKELPKVNKNTNIIEFNLQTRKVTCKIINKKKVIAQGNLKSVFSDIYRDVPEFLKFLNVWDRFEKGQADTEEINNL